MKHYWFTDLFLRLWEVVKNPRGVSVKPVEEVIKSIESPKPSPSEIIYEVAKSALGTDVTPNDYVSDEYACSEVVSTLLMKAGFKEFGVVPFTAVLYRNLRSSPFWEKVSIPEPGCIVISPTTYSSNPYTPIKNGHVGIVAKFGILSNDSATGLFKENYTLQTWRERYVVQGGYPMEFYKRV